MRDEAFQFKQRFAEQIDSAVRRRRGSGAANSSLHDPVQVCRFSWVSCGGGPFFHTYSSL
ncbi:hypothetical protein CI15_25550 [Paraburkholderia monticola]|uniref:Uncharacterized protein n=1 Tax=Paraburkholderia monticola TaxID=1399968 RepID=A0A149PFP9_9BURK|nr:hypothetical protein CI15_25550 [Paraburkholderia monticola]